MHDIRPNGEGGTFAADLATAFGVSAAEVQAAMRVVAADFASRLEQTTLSREGLAGLVEAVGQRRPAETRAGGDALRGEAVQAEGNALLALVLGSKDRTHALAARAARTARLTQETVERMLPALAAVTMDELAARARGKLADILRVTPSLGRWSRGEPHADLADILRRGCGAGPYGSVKLRRVVRRALAGPGSFRPRGPLRWYLRFMLAKPLLQPMRWVMERLRASA